jgi:hypothetical protein
MDGRAFLSLAQELIQGATEAHWRAAAGRAYYALMLECRTALQRWGFTVPGGPGTHGFIKLRYLSANLADLKAISYELEKLLRLRNFADYEVPHSPSFLNNGKARHALHQATTMIALLDAVEADPARRAAAVTAIQAAWP